MVAVVAVIAVILGVLYFTGVFGGDDESSNASQSANSSDQKDDNSGASGQGSGDDTAKKDTQEQDTQEQDTTDDQADSGDTGEQGSGAGSPEDAFEQYMQAIQDSDCETLKKVVMVPEMAAGSEDQFFEGMCKAPESEVNMDFDNVQTERVKDESEEVQLAVKAGGGTGYQITCKLVDGAWKVDPLSIEFE